MLLVDENSTPPEAIGTLAKTFALTETTLGLPAAPEGAMGLAPAALALLGALGTMRM